MNDANQEHPNDETETNQYLWEGSGPPDPAVQELEETLRPLRYTGTPPTVRRSHWRLSPHGARRLAAAAVIVVGVGLLALLLVPREGRAWPVRTIRGEAMIAANTIGADGRLGVGQWLETKDDSQVDLQVADIGTVTVYPNSRLRLLSTKAKFEHRLELARGRIEAVIVAPPRLFFVNTPSAVAVDLGCAYELVVSDEGDGVLEVTYGAVSLEWEGRASIVSAGVACRLKPQVGPGTPYRVDASDRFKRALERLDFEAGGDDALDVLLVEARSRDVLSLWHLLRRVEAKQVGRVYDRLAAFAAPPAGVTRQGVTDLDESMLDAWRRELGLR